jgi:CRP-like cAMP-binding protein
MELTSALLTKLRALAELNDDDVGAIQSLPINMRNMPAGQSIVRQGDHPTGCCLCVEGFLVRWKATVTGKRQIMGIHIPGDIPDLQSLHLHVSDHDLSTLTACTVGLISHAALRQLAHDRPKIADALWRDTLIEAAMMRERVLNLGQRHAAQRAANFFLEMRSRLAAVGRAKGNSFHLPITQQHIGEALGMSVVHVNRVLKELRNNKLLEMQRGKITILDERRLTDLGEFDSLYLHQDPSL